MSEIYSNDPLAGQMLEAGATPPMASMLARFCPQAGAYFGAMTAAEPLGSRIAINSFIQGCVNDGTWALLDWFNLSLGSEQASLINAFAPAIVATNFGCTFVPYRGFTGNGTTQYINSNQAFLTGPNYVRNSAMMGMYLNLMNTAGRMGNVNDQRLTLNATSLNFVLNSAGTVTIAGTAGPSCSMISRTTSTLTTGYVNGVSIGTDATVSIALTAGNCTFLRNGVTFSNSQHAAFFWGAGFSAAQALQFYTRLQTLMLALAENY